MNTTRRSRRGTRADQRCRVIVSTDIGGSDDDDFQSMVHYLLYADRVETEGLIASPWGNGRKEHILDVISAYAEDYPRLQRYSSDYPTPEHLRAVTKQGAVDIAPYQGFSKATEGSDWIIQRAHADDDRPLYVLLWGLPDDLAQALHDDPSIRTKLRVYYIAGPNKKWGVNAHAYLERCFSDLWLIENNATYRGWFCGGDQSGDLSNAAFPAAHIAGHGALGDYFCRFLNQTIKMGDTPSLAYVLSAHPERPDAPGWGGQFAPVHSRPHTLFQGPTCGEDTVEVFGIAEFVFTGPKSAEPTAAPVFSLVIGGQSFPGYCTGPGEYRVRFMPKEAGLWSYALHSAIPALHGQTGQFTAVPPSSVHYGRRQHRFSNWWSDRLDADLAEGTIAGAKTISRWREQYLRDFQARMDCCLG